MAHFKGFSGNLMDTTPLKGRIDHRATDLSISELSTTPQFRWMGEAAPTTPGNEERENSRSTALSHEDGDEDDKTEWTEGESRAEGTTDASFDQSLREVQSSVNDEDMDLTEHGAVNGYATREDGDAATREEEQELVALKHTLRTMNKSIVALNALVRSTIPKFQRMQNAIDSLDGLSQQYNQIMVETERTTQILEDPSWPGRTQEEVRYQQRKAADAERRRREEEERQKELERREEERAEKERQAKAAQEAAAKKSTSSMRGRGIGRGSTSTRATAGRGITRGGGISRGHSTSSSISSRPMASVSSRPSSIPAPFTRGRFG